MTWATDTEDLSREVVFKFHQKNEKENQPGDAAIYKSEEDAQ